MQVRDNGVIEVTKALHFATIQMYVRTCSYIEYFKGSHFIFLDFDFFKQRNIFGRLAHLCLIIFFISYRLVKSPYLVKYSRYIRVYSAYKTEMCKPLNSI